MRKIRKKEALQYHEVKPAGKIEVTPTKPLTSQHDLALAYSPGVAEPCLDIADNVENVYKYTAKGNLVGVISNGTAVLGLGDIGPEASKPVMEGKGVLFKKFAGIDVFDIEINETDPDKFIEIVKSLEPTFGGINLEDIKAPESFKIERELKKQMNIPVMHDDQHGTAIVTLAGLINASKVVGKELKDLNVVINGAGAAGNAIARLLHCVSLEPDQCSSVKNIVICDSKGIISNDRTDLNDAKKEALKFTNKSNIAGTLKDALVGADVFIGVSVANLLDRDDIRTMADDAIIFGLANPTPEIMPEEAKAGGAAVVATGRSDFPNQVNNVLAFPGIFKGALRCRAPRITGVMKLAAAFAIANCVQDPTRDEVIPSPLDLSVAEKVAEAVEKACGIDHHIAH